jgi:hypothetical protein
LVLSNRNKKSIKGIKAIVDDEDYSRCKKHKWYYTRMGEVHVVQFVTGCHKAHNIKRTYLHRFIMNLENGNGLVVDHINGDRLDNRKSNLRVCTGAENTMNRKLPTNNTSGYKGVYYRKNYKNRVNKKKRWSVYVVHKDKRYYGGDYLTVEEGARVYDKMACLL